MVEEYREILGIYEEFSSRVLKPKVLELDFPEAVDGVLRELREMGTISDEVNGLPLSVRVGIVLTLARGEGSTGVLVGTALAMLESDLNGYAPVHGGTLARGETHRVYYDGKVGKFNGEEVRTVGLRGIRWYRGEFVPEGDAGSRPDGRILLYDLAALVGIGFAAYDEALRYSMERKAFGKPIHEYEEIRRFLNEGYARLKASESLLLSEDPNLSAAVWQVIDAATFMTEKATQIFGGYGFINEYPVSKYMRDVRTLRSLTVRHAYV